MREEGNVSPAPQPPGLLTRAGEDSRLDGTPRGQSWEGTEEGELGKARGESPPKPLISLG